MLIHMNQTGQENKRADGVRTITPNHAPQSPCESNKIGKGYELDLAGTMRERDTYGEHARMVDEVMKQAQAKDVTTQKNYMTIMSHSMSGEDFARMMKEGYSAKDMEPEELVTIVDRIKAELASAGVVVSGYNDDLDLETLEQITGNTVMANELKHAFLQADVPLNRDNAEQVTKAWEKISGLEEASPQLTAYLLQNHLPLTPDELYLAKYAVAAQDTPQPGGTGGGYYREDIRGYYGQQASMEQLDAIQTQIDEVITQAGYFVEVGTKADALWMVGQSIPLTVESFQKLQQLKEALPVDYEGFVKTCAAAVAQGDTPGNASLDRKETIYEQANRILEQTNELTPQAAELAAQSEPEKLTLKAIAQVQESLLSGEISSASQQELQSLRARTQLEQVRLLMTAEVNLKLLRSGFQIETAPMEQLIKELESTTRQLEQTLYGKIQERDVTQMSLEQETRDTLAAIVDTPVAVLGRFRVQDADCTLRQLRMQGDLLRADYEQAGERYETMMTQVRTDLGDSIRKAFRNTDAILEDYNLPLTEDNRRAVRILGYNTMDLTIENIDRVKAVDIAVRETFRKLTPAAALQMIRDGEDPLSMNVQQLGEYLEQHTTFDQRAEKYSRYLYKLEQKGDITADEKEAYIELYRFVRQLEKNDGAAIGAVVHMGAELTLENLKSAMKSAKAVGSFGADRTAYMGHVVHRLADELSEQKSPMRMWEEAESLEVFADQIHANAAEPGDAEENIREQYRELTQLMKQLEPGQDALLRQLEQYHLPVTAATLETVHSFRKNPLMKNKEYADIIGETWKDCVESFTDAESAGEAFSRLAEETKQQVERALEENASSRLDVRMLQLAHRQFTTIAHLAKRERYEIPMELEGNLTLVSVRMIHEDTEEPGTIELSCETPKLGRMSARVSVSDGDIRGDFMTENEEAYRALTEWVDGLREHLTAKGYGSVSLHSFRGARRTENSTDTENMTKVSDREMYLLAREILRFM